MQSKLFLNKQPVMDINQNLLGYHLALEVVNKVDSESIAWDAVMKAFCERIAEHDGMSGLIANKPVFYTAPMPLVKEQWLPKMEDLSVLTVDVDISVLGDKDALESIREIVCSGASISVVGYENSDSYKKLLPLAKYVKLSAKEYDYHQIKTIVNALKLQSVESVIIDIETEDQFNEYSQTGAAFYQGYFFTNPVLSGEKELSGSKLALLKLLAEVNDPEVDFDDIVRTVGSDVGLTHRLLSAINHPSNDVPHIVESLKDAVNLMGLKRLKFWVNMMMLSDVKDVPKELMVTALVRAKFMEGLAVVQGRLGEKDRYFMTGMFSTLNAFLRVSMVDIVEQLPLSQQVKMALVDHSGDMGRALFIIQSLEQGDSSMLGANLDIMQVSDAYMGANNWTRKTLSGLHAV